MSRRRGVRWRRLWLVCASLASSLAGAADSGNLGLQREARNAYFAGFDRDRDGRVDVEEYLAYLSAGFDQLDRNGNGRLDADELPAGSRASRSRERSGHQQAVRRAFARLDRNADGVLDVAELTAPPR